METSWQKNILRNFNQASFNYKYEANLQRDIAKKLAIECSKQKISHGTWMDLGAGTGFLADVLENLNPNQSVLRVDGSNMMLSQNSNKSLKKLWNLNLGLPNDLSQSPNLIASSFALHWLSNPNARLKEWFSALAPGGWLALAVPIQGSFQEWFEAARLAQVHCTAIDFPSSHSLIESIDNRKIKFIKIEEVTQSEKNISSLLKPLIKVGGHATHHKPLKISEWRKLEKNWPQSRNGSDKRLTWLIQILLAQK